MNKYKGCVLLTTALFSLSTAVAQNACTNDVLNWDLLGPYPTFPQTLNSHTVNLSVSDPNSALPTLPPMPINANFYSANGSATEYDIYADLPTLGTGSITFDIAITGDPSTVTFDILDLDGQTAIAFLRQEVITITASYQGNSVSPVFTPTSQMQVSGNTVRGFQDVKPTPTGTGDLAPEEGILGVAFAGPVDSIQIEFSVDAANLTGSRPGFGLANINIACARAVGNLSAPQAIPTTNWFALTALLTALVGSVVFYRRRKS